MSQERKNNANLFARECIVDALLRLTKSKPLSSISISELTKLAGVSRMTFYRNYTSKEDVFSSCLDDILALYQKEEPNFPDSKNYYDLVRLKHCFQYFSHYKDFLKGVFRCGFGTILLQKLTFYIVNKWHLPDQSNEYELFAFAGALYNLYIGWAYGGYQESVDEMAQILNRIYTKENIPQ